MSRLPTYTELFTGVEVSRISFDRYLNGLLNSLTDLETQFVGQELPTETSKRMLFSNQTHSFLSASASDKALDNSERDLFLQILRSFGLKHELYEGDKILASVLGQPPLGTVVEFIAPLAGAKTTLARLLARSFGVELANVEPYKKNPYWRKQQEYPKLYPLFMSRSQTWYILASLYASMQTRLSPRINISDTSTHNDRMWARTYHETERDGVRFFSDDEYGNYTRLVRLLNPLFQQPDLLVILIPDSVEHLKEGVRKRAQAEQERTGELIFTEEGDETLAIQTQIIRGLSEDLPKRERLRVFSPTVNPIAVFEDATVAADLVGQIRSRLQP